MAKNFFSFIGAAVIVLSIFGALNLGHFNLYYGPDEQKCMKSSTP